VTTVVAKVEMLAPRLAALVLEKDDRPSILAAIAVLEFTNVADRVDMLAPRLAAFVLL
jgi:hypothetical protein